MPGVPNVASLLPVAMPGAPNVASDRSVRSEARSPDRSVLAPSSDARSAERSVLAPFVAFRIPALPHPPFLPLFPFPAPEKDYIFFPSTFLLPMPWLISRLRHLLCSCRSSPIPSRLFPIPALPSPPFPPVLSFHEPSFSAAHAAGCAIYSAPVSPAQSPVAFLRIPALPSPPFPSPTSDLPFLVLAQEEDYMFFPSRSPSFSAAHALADQRAAPSIVQLSVLPNPLSPFLSPSFPPPTSDFHFDSSLFSLSQSFSFPCSG